MYNFNRLYGSKSIPSVIVDFGPCTSVGDERTLENVMRILAIEKSKDKRIRQSEHQFGPSGKPQKRFVQYPSRFNIM